MGQANVPSSINVKIDSDQYQTLKEASEQLDRSIASFIREALSDYIDVVLPVTKEAHERIQRARKERKARVQKMTA